MQLACLFLVFFLQLWNSPEIAANIAPVSAALNLDPPHKSKWSIICYCSMHNSTYVPTQLLIELNVSVATCRENFPLTSSHEINSRLQKGNCNMAQRHLILLYLSIDMRNASIHVNYGISLGLCTITYPHSGIVLGSSCYTLLTPNNNLPPKGVCMIWQILNFWGQKEHCNRYRQWGEACIVMAVGLNREDEPWKLILK